MMIMATYLDNFPPRICKYLFSQMLLKRPFGFFFNFAFKIVADISLTVALFALADNCVYAP